MQSTNSSTEKICQKRQKGLTLSALSAENSTKSAKRVRPLRHLWQISKFFLLVLLFFIFSGCASTIHVKRSRPPREMGENIVFAEDIKILPAKKSLRVGEKLTYRITWIGIPVGSVTSHIKETTELKGREVYHIELVAKTNDFCSAIYRIEDRFVTYMDCRTLLPIKHELKRREGRHKKDFIVDYDHEKHIATYHNLREKWVREVDIPEGAHDPLSAMYFFRTKDVEVGTPIDFYVNMNEKNYHVVGKIEDKVILEVPNLGLFDAFESRPVATHKGKSVRKGRVWGYISCEESRVPLFGVVDVWVRLIGRVAITLTKVE